MAIDAIGNALNSTTSELSQSRLGQEDFIKLFLTELTFQDPLEPINNREFLAQMAQFANLEQTRVTNENTAQSIGLLGRQVEVTTESGESVIGAVTAIAFSLSGPVLSIKDGNGNVLPDVRMAQVKLVRI